MYRIIKYSRFYLDTQKQMLDFPIRKTHFTNPRFPAELRSPYKFFHYSSVMYNRFVNFFLLIVFVVFSQKVFV